MKVGFGAAAGLVLLACSPPPVTPVGVTVFHYDATGAIPHDVAARLHGAVPLNDGCLLPLQGGKEEVRFANRALRDPSTGRAWLTEVSVIVSKNSETRIDVGEVRPLRSADTEGVSILVVAHEYGGGFASAGMAIANDATCAAGSLTTPPTR